MKKSLFISALALLGAAAGYLRGPGVSAAVLPLHCSVSGYQGAAGLNAAATADSLAVTWDGERNQELRVRFVIDNGTPTIAELAARKKGAAWGTLATNVTPEFRVVSGRRRMDREAEEGLEENEIKEITPQVFEKYQWDPFWDAPLNVPGGMADDRRTIGLPRKPDEVHRATATYKANSCEVKTDKTHLTVTFPGVTLGLFAGQLQFTVYKGSNLIQQEVIASTTENSVAYKYDAGLKGLSTADSRLTWRDLTNVRQDYCSGARTTNGKRRSRPRTACSSPSVAGPAQSRRSRRRTTSSGRARAPRTSATTGIARIATRRSPSASARRKTKSGRTSTATSRSTARGPARCSTCRCSST